MNIRIEKHLCLGEKSVFILIVLYTHFLILLTLFIKQVKEKYEENLLHQHLCETLFSTGEHFAYYSKNPL